MSASPADDTSLLEALIDLERQGWQALADGAGGPFYRERLAATAVMVLPVGVMGREASIAAMKDAPPWASFTLSDAAILRLGGDAAALVYRARAQREGEPPYRAYMTSVYLRESDSWRLVLHQQTPLFEQE